MSSDAAFIAGVLVVVLVVIVVSIVNHARFMRSIRGQADEQHKRYVEMESQRIRGALREAEEYGYRRGLADGGAIEHEGEQP